jgi:hypothetical protein
MLRVKESNLRIYVKQGLAICLVALGALSLQGCGSIEVALGFRTRLDKLPVTALSASLSPAPALAPGKSGRLIITATTSDGKQLVTVGPGHGKVLFDSFTFDASVVQVSKKGKVSLPADPRQSDTQIPHIRITANGHPDMVAELDVPVRYDIAFAAHFSGQTGSSGFNGSDGLAGADGSTGSLDLTNPSPGGNGTNGGDGGNGQDGGDGQPGQSVHVWVALQAGAHPLLQVRAASPQREQFFLVDPNGGTLTIDANGGSGGSGGSAGRGGRGGAGGIGSPNGSAGLDGHDGMRGRDGSGGAPGSIIVSIDPQAKPFLDRLQLSIKSGNGVPGRAAEILTEPVAALW